jgi:uncharacterized protein YrrD
MKFKDNARIITRDGEDAGKIKRVVIDPGTKEATHIVIQKGFLFKEDKVIPMSLVGKSNEESLTLRADSGSLDSYPKFEESHYIATELSQQSAAHSPSGIGSLYWYPPVSAKWAIDSPSNGRATSKSYTKETTKNIPPDTVALKEDARVYGKDDGLIGNLETVFTKTPEDKVTHLLVSKGLIWTDKKLVPATWVNHVTEEKVTLSVSSQFVESLPSYNP